MVAVPPLLVLGALATLSCSIEEASRTTQNALDAAAPDAHSTPPRTSTDASTTPDDASVADARTAAPPRLFIFCGPLECATECGSLWDLDLQPFVSIGPLGASMIISYERRCGMIGKLTRSAGGVSGANSDEWFDATTGELVGRTWRSWGVTTDEGCEGMLPGPDCILEGQCSIDIGSQSPPAPCDPESDLGIVFPDGYVPPSERVDGG